MKPTSSFSFQLGFTLLEALITIVILAFGLLGLAGLQAKIQVSETEAFQRAQAILLAEDMANRISANRVNAACYLTNGNPLGTGTSTNDCTGLSASALDTCEWNNALQGAAEQKSGNKIGAMIGARGCVDLVAGSNPAAYRISVVWQGTTELAAPTLTCGAGLYGSEGYRRAVSNIVTVACLTLPNTPCPAPLPAPQPPPCP